MEAPLKWGYSDPQWHHPESAPAFSNSPVVFHATLLGPSLKVQSQTFVQLILMKSKYASIVCVCVCVNIQNIVLKETHTSSDFEYRWYWGSVCVSNLCMEVFLFSLVFGPIKDNLYLSTIINTYFNIHVHISLFFFVVLNHSV